MRVGLGDPVRSSDGQVIGTIHRLIVDPTTGEVRAVAIQRGGLLRPPVEALLSDVQAGPAGELHLRLPADEVEDLPRFVESAYTAPPADYVPPPGVSAGGILWTFGVASGAGMSQPGGMGSQVRSRLAVAWSAQDLENAVIREGSSVRDRAGEPVGTLHRLIFDSETGHLSELVVRQGLIAAQDLALPAALIQRLDDRVVVLAVSARWLHDWASLAPGVEVWTSDRVCIGTIAARAVDHLVVTSREGGQELRVPLAAFARVSRNRAILTADHAQTRLWAAERAGGSSA
jgi:sporulation protein YlmC with PRC-barrel domain